MRPFLLRPIVPLLAFLLISAVCAAGEQPRPAANDELAQAYQHFLTTLANAEQQIRRSPSFQSEAEQVGAYRHLLRSMIKGVEAGVLQDADFPYFRILDFWLREGGDNPDQRYAFSPIRGGQAYRVWGRLGSAARLELQIYSGRPWDGSGKSSGFLAFEDIEFQPDGSFEILVSAVRSEGNWLHNPADATTLFARHIYDDWNEQSTGEIHIDRLGFEGKRKTPESAKELTGRIQAAADMLAATSQTWPALVQQRYVQAREANTVSVPLDTYKLGGVKGRWMSGGHFKLGAGEVLLLRMPATSAHYQAVQLADMWFASLDHDNQISSLNQSQSLQASDGAYYYVISPVDPAYSNWLDSGALQRGVFMLRWDGMNSEIPEAQYPTAERIKLHQLEQRIPGFSAVSESQREQTRAMRRKHLQLRSHR